MRNPIGSFADIAFEVSSERVFTFDDYRRNSKARYSKHELINLPPALEYLGSEPEEISFKMIFTVSLAVNPAAETARLRELCLNGEADYLVLGNEVIGDHMWTIESVNETAKAWDDSGHIIFSEVEVKMVEYVEELADDA